jgi:putative aldouronate transport system permease protein
MLFNGGLVPTFFLWSNIIGVTDSIFALILPGLLLSPMSVLLVRTYFANSIPDTLFEAAQIDGANQFTIFRTIVLPLGKPILVTIGTFAGLGYWNDWLNGLYYLQRRTDLFNIQNILNRMVTDVQFLATNADMSFVAAELLSQIPTTGIQMAIAFAAIFPLLLAFPFLSRFYSKGLSLGALKG